MEVILQILAVIALGAFIFLAFSIISTLKKVNITLDKTAQNIDNLTNDITQTKQKVFITLDSINEIKQHLVVTLDNFSESSKKLNLSLVNVDRVTSEVVQTIDGIQNTANKFIDVIQPIEVVIDYALRKFMPGVSFTTKFVKAINRGISTFSSKMAK